MPDPYQIFATMFSLILKTALHSNSNPVKMKIELVIMKWVYRKGFRNTKSFYFL